MGAQARPLGLPAPDADVDVVALREDPAVPPGDRPQLEHGSPPVAIAIDGVVAQVGLERDEVHAGTVAAQRARHDSVRSVRADHDPAGSGPVLRPHEHVVRPKFDLRHLRPVAEDRPGLAGTLDEKCVQHHSPGHVDQRLLALPLEPARVGEPDLEAVDDVLDHGLDREREECGGATGNATAARLVAREPSPVQQQHRESLLGQEVGRGRPRRAGTDDDDVEALRHETNPLTGAIAHSLAAAKPLVDPVRREDARPRDGCSERGVRLTDCARVS